MARTVAISGRLGTIKTIQITDVRALYGKSLPRTWSGVGTGRGFAQDHQQVLPKPNIADWVSDSRKKRNPGEERWLRIGTPQTAQAQPKLGEIEVVTRGRRRAPVVPSSDANIPCTRNERIAATGNKLVWVAWGASVDRYLVLATVLTLDTARTSADPRSNHAAIAEIKSFGRTCARLPICPALCLGSRNAVSAIGNPRALAHRA